MKSKAYTIKTKTEEGCFVALYDKAISDEMYVQGVSEFDYSHPLLNIEIIKDTTRRFEWDFL